MPVILFCLLLFISSTPALSQESDYLGPRWTAYATFEGSATVRLILDYINHKEISPRHYPTPTVFSKNYIAPPPPTRCDVALDSLPDSPFADSLYQILGRPNITIKPLPDSIAGQYDIRSHTITLSRHSALCTEIPAARIAFSHELAHAFQATMGDILGDIWHQHNIRPPRQVFASYAAQDITEHQAEALSAAVNLLSVLTDPSLSFAYISIKNTQGQDVQIIADNRYALARTLDQYIPGTIILARALLSHPLYKSHPLHSSKIPDLNMDPIHISWPIPHPLNTELRMRIRSAALDMGREGPAHRAQLRAERQLILEEATIPSPTKP